MSQQESPLISAAIHLDAIPQKRADAETTIEQTLAGYEPLLQKHDLWALEAARLFIGILSREDVANEFLRYCTHPGYPRLDLMDGKQVRLNAYHVGSFSVHVAKHQNDPPKLLLVASSLLSKPSEQINAQELYDRRRQEFVEAFPETVPEHLGYVSENYKSGGKLYMAQRPLEPKDLAAYPKLFAGFVVGV